MMKRIVLIALTLAALDANAARAVIQVDLNARVLRLETIDGNARRKLDVEILPVVAESFHRGSFTPHEKIYRKFRSLGGNVYLENVIYFSGNRSIRTASAAALARQDRTSNSIALDPDAGSLVFDTIKRVGTRNTQIIIMKGEGPAHH